jgi:hypothetical protein
LRQTSSSLQDFAAKKKAALEKAAKIKLMRKQNKASLVTEVCMHVCVYVCMYVYVSILALVCSECALIALCFLYTH